MGLPYQPCTRAIRASGFAGRKRCGGRERSSLARGFELQGASEGGDTRSYRQGDIYIEEVPIENVAAIRAASRPVDRVNGALVLAHGEAGHTHAIEEDEEYVEAFESRGARYLLVKKAPVQVVHPEHEPITLHPMHYYEVIRQREYRPETFVRTRLVSD